MRATEKGHAAVVELLVGTGLVSPYSKHAEGRIFSRAAEKGHAVVVKLLLGTGLVSPDSKHAESRTPLSRAVVRICPFPPRPYGRQKSQTISLR
jgi:hypothetical protein